MHPPSTGKRLLAAASITWMSMVLANPSPAENDPLAMIGMALSLPAECRSVLFDQFLQNEAMQRCLPYSALQPLGSSSSGGQSLPPPDAFNAAVGAVCGAPPCPAPQLGQLRRDLRAKCASIADDQGQLGTTYRTTLYLLEHYDPLRGALCVVKPSTTDSDPHRWCAIESYGKLYPAATAAGGTVNPSAVESLSQDDLCTNCNKGIFTVLRRAANQTNSSSSEKPLLSTEDIGKIDTWVTKQCGAAFLDGNTNTTAGDPATSASPPALHNHGRWIGSSYTAVAVIMAILTYTAL